MSCQEHKTMSSAWAAQSWSWGHCQWLPHSHSHHLYLLVNANLFVFNCLHNEKKAFKTNSPCIHIFVVTKALELPVTSRVSAINLSIPPGEREANPDRTSVNTVAKPCLAPFLEEAKPFTRRVTLYSNSSQLESSSASILFSSIFES